MLAARRMWLMMLLSNKFSSLWDSVGAFGPMDRGFDMRSSVHSSYHNNRTSSDVQPFGYTCFYSPDACIN